jgi:hypothetical protein
MPGLPLALLFAAFLAGCGVGDGGKTFEGDGYSFTYPEEWEQREGSGSAEVGDSISSVSFGPSRGANGLTVSVYRLQVAVTEENIESIAPEVAATTDQIFRQTGGRVTAEPTRVTVAGHPGFSASGTAVTPQGTHVHSQVTLVFDQATEYFLNCQFTPDQAEEMQQGCSEVVSSLHLD